MTTSGSVALAQDDDGAGLDDATRNAAREMGREGVLLYQQANYEKAQDLLHRAYELIPAPTIALYEARSLVELGRWVEAAERYEVARRTSLDDDASAAFVQAVEDAGAELEALRPRIPRLTIKVEGASDMSGVTVLMDGATVPAPLVGVARTVDPGEHEVEARGDGYETAKAKVSIVEGSTSEVILALTESSGAPPPPPEDEGPSGSPLGAAHVPLAWASLAVGAAGLGVGVVAGGLMLSAKGDLDDQCVDDLCPDEAQDDLDSFRTMRVVSGVGYGIGLAGVAAGVILLLTAPDGGSDAPAEAHVTPWLSHNSVGLAGSF